MSDHSTRVLSRPEFIALIAALMALNALAVDVMLPALPYMGEALGVTSENERQYVIASYMLGMGIAVLGFGPLTDRFGRRRVLVWSILLYAFSALAAGFATSIEMLLFLRATTYIGVFVEFVAAVAWIPSRRGIRRSMRTTSTRFVRTRASAS